jgi:signal-transduction protein with cAMP-binding, CBS, and nucleotidyltransferase domain
MMKKVTTLNSTELQLLTENCEVLTFKNDFDLVYENQVPCAGIALIQGEIEIIRKSKVEYVVKEGHLIGVSQILSHEPMEFGCRVKGKSKVVLLGRSDILNFSKNKKSKLFPLLSAINNI